MNFEGTLNFIIESRIHFSIFLKKAKVCLEKEPHQNEHLNQFFGKINLKKAA